MIRHEDTAVPGSVAQVVFGMVVHGGAGTLRRDRTTAEADAAHRAALHAALQAGYAVLASGGPSLDAVEAAVRLLEDHPRFNAGRGAVFTHDGTHALDAAIMDGATGRAGAVAAVTDVRNPVVLARAVMERCPHVLLVGRGAEAFARLQGLEPAPPEYFHTAERWSQLQRAREREALADDQGVARDHFRRTRGSGEAGPEAAGPNPGAADTRPEVPLDGDGSDVYGTVGAVALDRAGGLAAATSTGGMTNKRWGRVGDAPVVGAGTYADDACAVGGTGWGEYFLRNVVAYDVAARRRYKGISLARAAHEVIFDRLESLASDTGGVIGIDRDGHIVWTHNTPGMYRGLVDEDGRTRVAIYRDEG